MRYAVRNIWRLKGRSFLAFAISFSILLLSMVGVMLVRICEDSKAHFFGPLDGSVHVTDDEFQPFFTYDAAADIGEKTDMIAKVSASFETACYFFDMTHLGTGEYLREIYAIEEPYPDYPKDATHTDYHEGFTICCITEMAILDEVYGGDLVMVEGEMIMAEDNENGARKIVISAAVAEQNGLSIGDTVGLDIFSLFREEEKSVHIYLMYRMNKEYVPHEYTVCGIYERKTDNTLSVPMPDQILENKVYVPISTLSDLSKNEFLQDFHLRNRSFDCYEMPTIVPDLLYFHLADINDAEALEKGLNEIGFFKSIVLTPYVSDTASSPSARLAEIISMLLIGIIVLGCAIFVLAVLFNMKARHRELSMLTAIGKKRSAVAFDFFLELSILVLAALILGAGMTTMIVTILSVPLTTYLFSLENATHIENETADLLLLGDGVGNTLVEKVSDFSYLLREYITPSVVTSCVVAVGMMALIFSIIIVYVKRINALSEVGGKE